MASKLIRPVIHQIDSDIRKTSIYLRGEPKLGKTTLWDQVIKSKFNGDPTKGLLIICGNETGFTMVDQVQYLRVRSYEELMEVVDFLVKGKGTEHNIEMICFDTVDELIRILEEQTIREYNLSQKADKKVSSINAAFGGFHKGQEHTADHYLNKLLGVLQNHFGVWVIGHTSYKNVKNKAAGDEEGRMRLTGAHDSAYVRTLSYNFDVIVTGLTVYDYEEVETEEFGKLVTRRYQKGRPERRLYFRDTDTIDAGGRFYEESGIPEYMVLEYGKNNGAEFIKQVENAKEHSKNQYKTIDFGGSFEIPSPVTPEPAVQENVQIDDSEELVAIEAVRKEIQELFSKTENTDLKRSFATAVKKFGSLTSITDMDTLLSLKAILE